MSDSTDYNPADNNLGEEPDDPEIGSQGEAELVSEEESFLSPEPGSRWARFWEGVTRAGLGDIVLRLGTHTLLLASILIVAWGMRVFYRSAQVFEIPQQAVLAAPAATTTPTDMPAQLPAMVDALPSEEGQPEVKIPSASSGIRRLSNLDTVIPSRPRMEVVEYTVQVGDTLFGIAEKFGLKPETLLWGNQFTLGDNPHNLRPEQKLNILPVDGTYHLWSEGDGLNGVAQFFGVTPEDIINFPGNRLNPETIGDLSRPNIEPGTWLVIPGGKRSFVSWSLPPGGISREDPGVAKGFGAGVCGSKVDGAIGSGAFVWPANSHLVTGFDWSPDTNHSGIDIEGDLGNPVYAGDNGVVVYAGWNNWGYGNVVVINHGNGWQTLYAHLDTILVSCGQSVFQGGTIGTIGSTGNSTGPHLHFEMMYNGVKVNPHSYLP